MTRATPGARGVDTRARIQDAADRLFARQGYAGTGLKQLAAEAQAPFGSIYHFFPGGKDDLAEDMIRRSGQPYLALTLAVLDAALEQGTDPAAAVLVAFATAGERLAASDYADACPVATMALDVASTHDRLRQATADVFSEWHAGATAWFESRAGVGPDAADDLARAFVMLLEGAFLLSRAARSTDPMEAAGRSMATLVRSAQAG